MRGLGRPACEELLLTHALWDGIPRLSCIPLISAAQPATKQGLAVCSMQQEKEKSLEIPFLARIWLKFPDPPQQEEE